MPRVSNSRCAFSAMSARSYSVCAWSRIVEVGGVGRRGGPRDVAAVDLPAVHVRVVEAEHRPALQQLAGDRAGRALPLVGDVLLVGDAEQQHLRPVERLGVGVEELGRAVDDVARHPGVDLLGQLDEAERVLELGPHLVGEVVRVDRDAVPADAGAGVERLEAERLGGGAVDRVPQVDAELVAEDRHLVHQRDVDVPVRVLQELGHLGLAGGLGLDDGVADGAVEARGRLGAGRGQAADHLGGVADAVDLVARVDPLR